MHKPMIQQIMVGMPQKYGVKDADDPMERKWESGIVKHAVSGKVWASKTNLEGDGQADLKHHGGPEKAIFVYPTVHYPHWQKVLNIPEFTIGAFGENLAVVDFTEENVCIGDTFQVGEAIVQVSQPRQPCWKPARRWKTKDLSVQVQQQGLTGWYFRVLKEGYIQAGDCFQLLERPYPEWTVARCNEVMHLQKHDVESTAKLAACELLTPSWRNTLQKRVQSGKKEDTHNRLIGPNE